MSCPDCEQLACIVAKLDERLRAVEGRGRGLRDQQDRELFRILAQTTEGRTFTTRECFMHAKADARLRDALRDACIDNPKQLGRLLRRLEHQVFDGIGVTRRNEDRAGVVWIISRV